MDKRGAYFFMIDAMIASLIVVSTLIYIFSTRESVPDSAPSYDVLDSYLSYLATTKISEYPGTMAEELLANHNITNPDNTLQDQIVEYYYLNSTRTWDYGPLMKSFIYNVTRAVVPADRSLQVLLNDTVLFNRTTRSIGESTLMLSSKHLCFKRINESYVYGPVALEVKIWI